MLYLTALNSPFASEKANPEDFTTTNVMAFLRVCSSGHPEEAFGSLSLKEWFFQTRMQTDLVFFGRVITECFQYMRECSQSPVTVNKDTGQQIVKKKETTPFPLMMVVMMTSKLGMDMEQAWNTPVGQAVWFLTAFAIQEGSDTEIVTTEADERAVSERAALEKMQAEALARIKEEAARTRKNARR